MRPEPDFRDEADAIDAEPPAPPAAVKVRAEGMIRDRAKARKAKRVERRKRAGVA